MCSYPSNQNNNSSENNNSSLSISMATTPSFMDNYYNHKPFYYNSQPSLYHQPTSFGFSNVSSFIPQTFQPMGSFRTIDSSHQNKLTFNDWLKFNPPPLLSQNNPPINIYSDQPSYEESNGHDSLSPQNHSDYFKPSNGSPSTPTSTSTVNSQQLNLTYSHQLNRPKKKPGKPVPEEKKDQTYWEKREKNNLSAKRSREIRRMKAKCTDAEVLRVSAELEVARMHLSVLRREEMRLKQMISDYSVR